MNAGFSVFKYLLAAGAAFGAPEVRAQGWEDGLGLWHPDSARVANARTGFYGGLDIGFVQTLARGAGPAGSMYFGGSLSSGTMLGGRFSFQHHTWMDPVCVYDEQDDEWIGNCWYNNHQLDLGLQLETRALFPHPKFYWRAGAGPAYYAYEDRNDLYRTDPSLPSSSRSSFGLSSSAGIGGLMRMTTRMDLTAELGIAEAYYFDGRTHWAVTATLGMVWF